MVFFGRNAGLMPEFPSPAGPSEIEDVVTEEAAIRPPLGRAVAVTPLVKEGDTVARGAALACLRHAPDVCFAAPIAGKVARMSLLPGRRMSEIVLFRDDSGGVETHDTNKADTQSGLRRLMQDAGMWPRIARRPFGGMPHHAETPAAIFVMATDTRPQAPNVQKALDGQRDAFARGLDALTLLTDGPVVLCHPEGVPGVDTKAVSDRIQFAPRGTRHPQGSPGICIHQLYPADIDTPVWDVHAEDVAALGTLLTTGSLPMTRLVSIAGPALRESRTVRTHIGADLRQLTQRIVAPGPHLLMSGSPLDGLSARWLGGRDRQVAVLPRAAPARQTHWLFAALTQSAGTRPAIPTTALSQAFGGALPAAAFIRALASGDEETAMTFGLLSLLEEDVALADYVLSEGGTLLAQFRALLDHVETEFAA
ncbi:Na(+)-translocating NADH-quinone reductase subunit A [Marivita hallyeonensis]|uniref:Na+-transporting NADH:ubiquinone oxidoreductase subunit A n=1 Tax=Marivita hallyeonensis TaxID=996342 RepID=A0A1M5NHP8_9RHOB|nr:Na(+)-translocating NADH-quinone reductase subunit A [Marivita hallyeonensis]SHG88987.1 Na+-transporting NADH:ubiquinone oxidoreductase subunit A [Marivita hallyeonensis]